MTFNDIPDKDLQALLKASYSKNDIHNLSKSIANFLQNPIAVYDANYYIIANSPISNVEDQIWLAGMKRGYSSYEYAALQSKLNEDTSPDAYQITEKIGNARRRLQKLTIDRRTIGYYSVLENNNPFDKIPTAYYEFAGHILAKELCCFQEAENNYTNNRTHYLFRDLLHHNFKSRQLFNQRMVGTEFDLAETYYLFLIDMSLYTTSGFPNEHMYDSLKAFFSNSWSIFDDNYIIVLVKSSLNSSDFMSSHSFIEFNTYLEKLNLRCCLSNLITDLYHLRSQYDQCSLILKYFSKVHHDTNTVLQYDNYRIYLAINALPQENILDYCTAAILQIYQDDQKNKSFNLETVFQYLNTGKSISQTANALFVHRNTVSYRINKISEQYHIDFLNEHQLLQHYFSCMILKSMMINQRK